MAGLGGILAAMAQGFGAGMVKNVEHGWKEDETNKLLNWKTEEADKQRAFDAEESEKKRQHDFELEDHKSRNAISEAAAKARISARYGGGKNGGTTASKNLTGAMQVLGIYDSQLNSLQEKLAATEDKEQKAVIQDRINSISSERDKYLKLPDTISAFKGGDQMGRALYLSSGGDMDLYSPKPEMAKSAIEDVEVVAPERNMIDMNNLSSDEAQQIAAQKREEQSRLRFQQASNEAKKWAEKRNQYAQSTFIPRTF